MYRKLSLKEQCTMSKFEYEIVEKVAVLSEGTKGWSKQLNLISWNGREPKYDIRDWSEENEKMGKGMTFSTAELEKLHRALNELID